MIQRTTALIFILLCAIASAIVSASPFDQRSSSPFAPADRAFVFDFNQQGDRLTLSWQVEPGYYLYRQRMQIDVQDAALLPWQFPAGQPHSDEFYGKTEIFRDGLTLPLTITRAGKDARVTVTYQGCAAAGFCYPPETRVVPLDAVAPTGSVHSGTADSAPSAGAMHSDSGSASAAEGHVPSVQSTPLPFSPLWALLIGIGIAFTPCVLPMYPLISGIILGGNRTFSMPRLFTLAMVYVQGMALTYTVMGIVVAAAGLRFQAALQAPAVLITLSVLFTALAMSMFGLFTLQLPSALQTRLTLWSNRQQGGSLPGVLLMGALAGLICSPCTTAPLSAILLYIAQSGNVLAGAGTLYLYALGMGLPLIAITLFGNRLLPRRGPWMQTVKEGFGFAILALPVFLLERVLGDTWGIRLWSLLGVAFFGWAFISALKSAHGWMRAGQIALLAAMLIVARPLQDWAFGTAHHADASTHPDFQTVSSITQFDQKRQESGGKITMLDLYADWCVACKEFEKYTFSDPTVQVALSNMQLLQANVTKNTASDSALLQRLQVLGLPTILFFDASGREIPASRVTGFMQPKEFHQHLRKLSP